MLTNTKLRALKPRSKPYRIADAHGLAIEVRPNSGLYWRFRYRYAGKAKMLSFGVYPVVSLAEAREKREEARAMLREGADPSATRQAEKSASEVAAADTFGPAVAASRRSSARPVPSDRPGRLRFPVRPHQQQADERKYGQRRIKALGLHRQRNDWAWLPQHGRDALKRTGMDTGRDRAPVGAR
jgi:hypothetical protein